MKGDADLRAIRRATAAFGLSLALAGAGLGALAGYSDRGRLLAASSSAWTEGPLTALAILACMSGLVLLLALGARRGHGRP